MNIHTFSGLVSAGPEMVEVRRTVPAPFPKGTLCGQLICPSWEHFLLPCRGASVHGPAGTLGDHQPSEHLLAGLVCCFPSVTSHIVEGQRKQTLHFSSNAWIWLNWIGYLLGSFNTSWVKTLFSSSVMPSVWAKVIFVTDRSQTESWSGFSQILNPGLVGRLHCYYILYLSRNVGLSFLQWLLKKSSFLP